MKNDAWKWLRLNWRTCRAVSVARVNACPIKITMRLAFKKLNSAEDVLDCFSKL